MGFNPSAPTAKLTVYHKRPSDAAWTDISSIIADWNGYSSKFNYSKGVSLLVNNLDGDNYDYFHVGDSFRVFAGYDTVYPQPILQGKIFPNGIKMGDATIDLTVNDYLAQLSYEHVYLSKEGTNYNGWECSTAIEDMVLGLNGAPLTMATSGSYNQLCYVVDDNDVYGMPITKLDAVNKIMDIMIDTDFATATLLRPLKYYYYQYEDYDGSVYTARFKLIKEDDVLATTTVANKSITATTNGLTGSVVTNDDFYNKINIDDDRNQYVQDDDSIARFGLYSKKLTNSFPNPVQNMDVASMLLYTGNRENHSFSIEVRDWFAFNLGDIVAVSGMRNGLFNRNHIVVEISGSPTQGIITLANAITDLKSYLS